MTTSIRVGPVCAEHAGELLTVQRAAYVTEAQRYAAPDIPPLTETLAEVLADIGASNVLVFGAWLGERLVGSVRGRMDGVQLEVARFSVAPDVQGRGVGHSLLSAVEAATPPGVRALWLVTGADSTDNLRLYRRAGYRPAGYRNDAVGIRLAVLEKVIAA